MIIVLGLLFILICWIYYEKNKSSKHTKGRSDKFWERELQSMTTRSKDISSLDYITIPLDQLPLHVGTDKEFLELHKELQELSNQSIVNLSGISNTELRFTYGAPNFNTLSAADNNFIKLLRLLDKWGKLLYQSGYEEEALQVLSYSVECGTDISNSFILLASIYAKRNQIEKLKELIQKAEELNSLTSQNLLASLKNMLPKA